MSKPIITYKVEREGDSDPFYVWVCWYKDRKLTNRSRHFFHTAEEREEFLRGVEIGYRGPTT